MQLTDPTVITNYILAGNATFTLVSAVTGNRFTYRVRVGRGPVDHLRFVSLLTGSNNTEDYTFLGTIFPDGRYGHGRKSSVSADAKSAAGFNWFWTRALGSLDIIPMEVEFYHSGKCGRCGRLLTTPQSISIGIGPVCASLA